MVHDIDVLCISYYHPSLLFLVMWPLASPIIITMSVTKEVEPSSAGRRILTKLYTLVNTCGFIYWTVTSLCHTKFVNSDLRSYIDVYTPNTHTHSKCRNAAPQDPPLHSLIEDSKSCCTLQVYIIVHLLLCKLLCVHKYTNSCKPQTLELGFWTSYLDSFLIY